MTEQQRRYRVLAPNGSCIEHGPAEISGYTGKDGYVRRYCLACRRARNMARGVVKYHWDSPRCRRGLHLKTRFTWRVYQRKSGPKKGQKWGRCLPCQYMLEKQRGERRARDRRPAAA